MMNPSPHPANKSTVTREQIRDGLSQAGLKKGDIVVAHSSLSSFGHVVGGADAVIDALLDVLGLEGTLIMPSHTNVGERDVAGYDPLSTPVRRNIGKIPETFWRRRDVHRGRHPPRHPWAVKGPRAGELLALSESMKIGTQHVGGLLNRVADLDGYVLLLGSMHNGNTSVHTGQALAVGEAEGVVKCKADFMADFDEIDEPLLAAGVMKIVRIGDAQVRLMKSRGLFAVIKELYHRKYIGAPFSLAFNFVPDPDHLSCLEYQGSLRALRVLEVALERAFAAARSGSPAADLDAVFKSVFEEQGGSFADEGRPWRAGAAALIEKGVPWGLDGAIRLDGYHAALGRAAFPGRVPAAVRVDWAAALKRVDQVAASIRPGVPVAELFRPLAGGAPFEVYRIGRRREMLPGWGIEGRAWAQSVEDSVRNAMAFEAGQLICIGASSGLAGFLRDLYRVDAGGATRMSVISRTIRKTV
jgi:aminoglycoside N3'-acetyltransferase